MARRRLYLAILPAAEAGGNGDDSHDPNALGTRKCVRAHVTLFESVWESWRGHDSATGFPVRSHHPPIRSAILLAGRRLRANSFTATLSLYDARSSFVNWLLNCRRVQAFDLGVYPGRERVLARCSRRKPYLSVLRWCRCEPRQHSCRG